MTPLAEQIRPQTLDEFIGQAHLVGDNGPLRAAIVEKHRFSFILWGPPGTGKTTLARIYARGLNGELFELSAVSAGKQDIKRIVEYETEAPKMLFLDEIHRFNKLQQDILLPYVETGEITLIGATTENPSFEIIAPLLSRLHVFSLYALSTEEMTEVIDRTGLAVTEEARRVLAEMGEGDARKIISLLEEARHLYETIDTNVLAHFVKSHQIQYDKEGDEHYNTISAFIKSMRASQPDAALYYLARMLEGGEDPKFIARRLVIFAGEDIGLAQSTALVVANETFRAVETVGLPEAQINLAHCTAYLAQANKDRSAYEAYFEALDDVKRFGNLAIPYQVRNAPTRLMKEMGYGEGYEKYTDESFLPADLQDRAYLTKRRK
ncbi:MAG: AAA family ATPase [Parcubacteria group bacterium SW_4_49_11]|nr:MAG: AAA family ATPase [Parcubacteria group bacterium SW_4_49_11]